MPSTPALVGARYRVEGEVARGGMGVVHRAWDALSGAPVALKRMLGGTADLARFQREAAVLRRLDHPAIVRYVDHGEDADGPWIAMEWIDGPSLEAAGAAGRRLALPTAVELGAQIADALAFAHEAGVLHRDVKPANVILAGEVPLRARLIDFGVARDTCASAILTKPGTLVGTPLYMAPEQLRGEAATASADVYALGAVIFELVSGRPPFPADSAFAIIGRVLLEQAPSLAEVAPHAPVELVELVDRALARSATERPSAREMGATLRALALSWAHAPTISSVPPPRASVDLAGEEHTSAVLVARGCDGAIVRAATLHLAVACESLPDGTSLALFSDARSPDAPVLRAVRAALAVVDQAPMASLVVAAGRVASTGGRSGQAFERAASVSATAPGVHVDPATSSLLEGRFDLTPGADGSVALGAEVAREGMRLLLGRPTPTVGRHAELAQLAALADAVREEGAPRVALVTAPPGQGKSRLRRELLELLGARPEPLKSLLVRFEPASETRAWGALGRALQSWGSIEAPDARAAGMRLVEMGGLDARGAAHLRELLGATSESDEPFLAFARASAEAMREGLREALAALFSRVAGDGALVLVLEDIHWADAATLTLVGELAAKPTLPLAVTALGRPEAEERVRDAWARRVALRIELGPLPARSAARLVRSVLPASTAESVVLRIVELGAGNPLVLEELVRAFDASGTVSPTASAESVFEARIARLAPRERLVARAAAVLGEVFWVEGVEAMLATASVDVRDALRVLEEEEVVTRAPAARLEGATEMVFRHALVRDAAEAGLPADARSALHGAACAWRRLAGDPDVGATARHAELGGLPTLAGELWAAAGHAAWRALDGEAARASFERAVSLLPALHADLFGVHASLEEIHRAAGRAGPRLRQLATLRRLARRGTRRDQALVALREAELAWDASRYDAAVERARRASAAALDAQEGELEIQARILVADALREQGHVGEAMRALDACLELAPGPALLGRILQTRGVLLRRENRLADACASYDEARLLYESVGARSLEALVWNAKAYTLIVSGRLGEAADHVRRALALRDELGFERGRAKTLANLANVHLVTGEWAKARELLDRALVLHRQFDREAWEDTLILRARVALAESDAALAAALLEESAKLGQASGSTYDAAHHGLVAAWTARATGDLDAARAHLGRARDAAARSGLRSLGVAIRAELAAVTGDVAAAETLAAELTVDFATEWRAETTASLSRVLPEGAARAALARATQEWLEGAPTRVGDDGMANALLRRWEWRSAPRA